MTTVLMEKPAGGCGRLIDWLAIAPAPGLRLFQPVALAIQLVLAIRLAKIACVAAIAFYAALVAFGNVSDHWTNFAFVTQVLDMDDVPAASHIRWRAVNVARGAITVRHLV
jgi:Predicted small integral membrane protein (DUF2165)